MAKIEDYRALIGNPNIRKALDVIASAEGTTGYDTAFGGGVIPGLGTHPGTRHEFTQTDGKKNVTTAAGRYQFIQPTWEGLQKQLGLPDFGPDSQDIGAIALLDQAGALGDVLNGDISTALQKSGKVWASLPSSPYAQPKRSESFIAGLLDKGAAAIMPSAQAGELPQGFAGKVAKARAAGYSDDEISAFLSEKPDFAQKVAKAREAGYSDDEITGYLGIAPPALTQPATAQPAQAVDGSPFGAPMPLNQQNTHARTPQETAAQAAQAQTQAAQGGGVLGGLAMGVRDPIDAGAQMLRRAVPESVGNAVDAFGNKLADMGLPVARSNGVAGVDASINQVNAKYEGARKAAGRDGIDFARIGGNIAGAAPVMGLTPGVAGMGMLGRVGVGAAQGGVMGALNPVIGEANQKDFAGSKGSQAGLGAALGGVTPLVTSAIGRVIAPKATRAGSSANLLTKEGITLTPGQMAGGVAQRAEDIAMSAPVVGDAIRAQRVRGIEQLNRAVYNRVLKPIGGKTDALGREAVADVSQQVSNAYDDVLSKVQLAPDKQFTNDIAKLRTMARVLPDNEAAMFNDFIEETIVTPFQRGQRIDGLTFKEMETALRVEANNYLKSMAPKDKKVGQALVEAQTALRNALVRSNPKQASRLKSVNESFAQLTRLQTAAAKTGAKDGVFTPSQLDAAVRAGDLSVRKNKYAKGGALMQDLADAARSRMTDTVPNSGTTDRALLNLGAAGGALAISPALALGGLAATLPYLKGIDKVTSKVMFARPAGAEAVANQLQRLPPGLLGVLAQ